MASAVVSPIRQRGSVQELNEIRESQKNEVIQNIIPLHQQYQHPLQDNGVSQDKIQGPPALPQLAAQRKLCSGEHNHCYDPEEKNVFSPPSPTPPTPAPSLSEDRVDPDSCTSDGQGNFGDIEGPSFRTIQYRYQVETTIQLTAELTAVVLNLEVLQDVEKAISDDLVKRFFLDSCSSPVIDISTVPMLNSNVDVQPPEALLSKVTPLLSGGGHRLLSRRTEGEYHQNLVGLSAAPEDLVLEGQEGEACPFPTTNGQCFVIGGGVTVYGDNEEGSSEGLSWIDEGVHEELQQSMNSGDLEQTVQTEHPHIVAIRYIPPGTDLPVDATDPDNVGDTTIGGRSPALSWVLIGLGVFILMGLFLYTLLNRSRNKAREQDERDAAVVGAFPVVVSKQNVSRARKAQEREEAMSTRMSRSSYDMSSPQYISSPPDLLGRYSSGSDDSDGDEGVPLHVFQDDESSPRTFPENVSTSWKDQILRSPHDDNSPFGGGSALDPNQPLVQPILDEEGGYPNSSREYRSSHSQQSSDYHSAYSDDYPPSYYAGSSHSGSQKSSSERLSPSKLSVAFERGEII